MLFRTWREHMSGHWLSLVLVMLAQILNTLMSLWLPTLNAQIINDGVIPGDVSVIWQLGAVMLGVSVLQCAGMIGAAYYAGKIAMQIGRDLRQEVCEHVLGFGSAEIRSFTPASLITRATNDVNTIQGVIFMTFMIMIQSPIMALGAVIMAVSLDAPLSLLFAAAVPVLIVVVAVLMRFMSPLFSQQQEKIDGVAARIHIALSGVRIIRAFGRKNFMDERFSVANKELKSVALRIGNLFALVMPSVQIIISLSSVAVVWFGSGRYFSGEMQIGSIVAFLTYLMQLLGAVMMASMMFIFVPRAEVSSKRLHEVMSTVASVSTPESGVELSQSPLTVEFRDVSLSFPKADRPVLEGLNLVFEPGKTTAIVGSTGSGKTSLLQLLMRCADPTSGKITVNGIDLKDLDLDDWHSRLAVVTQSTYLFSGTIASTVAGVEPREVTPQIRQRAELALRKAQAAQFVSELKDGLDSEVQAGGKNFSGGQRQRLSVARALYRQVPLLVLDDPFSALDFATEAALRGEMRLLGAGVTQVLVAQRVASVRHADQIVVLDSGQIAGVGSHEELLETCLTYQEIVESQLTLEEVL